MTRPDNLGALPFADYADADPNRLPLDGDPCAACNAGPGEPCRVGCIGEAAWDDELRARADVLRAEYFARVDGAS